MGESKKLQVIEEGDGGRNKRFKDIETGKVLTVDQIANNIENYPGYHVVHRDGQLFIRSNPDGDKNNNLE
ncbi:DUF3892 domain-containing protein [Alkalibaculum sp. M08DMB]|uniref:DUF3892 domain-containing protein n=1 Tax=Alkalibaculum sporogenes TaxID=2655001 RepID=A0A6A7K8U2_9FIRM|nr:DUF3892 domain-containing protein [Alkalibaculum sporogenes]MPW25775.1 DUF3892 domain-containing protein [Alkalibaculum sporogenes]